MKKIKEIISRVNEIKPNPFTDTQKMEWVANLDAQINSDYLHVSDYTIPSKIDSEILVASPYDEMYVVYLMAQVDFYQGEMNNYNAEITRFQTMLDNYSAYIQRTKASPNIKINW